MFQFFKKKVAKNLVIPASEVMIKTIALPMDLSSLEMESHIALNIREYTLYSLADICFDFVVLSRDSAEPGCVDVLLVVARAEVVEKYIMAATADNIQVQRVIVTLPELQHQYPPYCVNVLPWPKKFAKKKNTPVWPSTVMLCGGDAIVFVESA